MLEKKFIKAQEEAIMRKNLGMPPKPGDQEILDAKNQGIKLKSYEIKELIRKNDFEGEVQEDIIRDADKMAGLGFSKYGGNQNNGEPDASITKLEGEGLDDHRARKLAKDKKKKSKDEKKHKKDKKHKKSKKKESKSKHERKRDKKRKEKENE